MDTIRAHIRLAALLALLLVGVHLPPAGAQVMPSATVEPTSGPIGTTIQVRGAGWPAGRSVTVSFGKADQRIDSWFEWARVVVAGDGTLRLTAVVPRQYTAVNGSVVPVSLGDYSIVLATTPGPEGSSITVGARFTVTAAGPPAPLTVNRRFRDYYLAHDGPRVLGSPLSEVRFEDSRRVQYFEKGRLEDHLGEPDADGPWRFLYGRLGAELTVIGGHLPVGGDTSTISYAMLAELAAPDRRLPPPPGWSGLAPPAEGDSVFVPVDSGLRPAPGHYVPWRFWNYVNQPTFFPGGWLHDIGLPLTPAMPATVSKIVDGLRVERAITLQLFERTVLTDDPTNPPTFQIERANVGADYLKVARGPVVPGDVVLHPAFTWVGPTASETGLPAGIATPAWEWQSLYNPTINMDDEADFLQRELEAEGWLVTARTGGFVQGTLEAVKGTRVQIIIWWLGVRPGFPPEQPELGTRMRVLVGTRP